MSTADDAVEAAAGQALQPSVQEFLDSDRARQSVSRRGQQPRDAATGRILAHEPTPDLVRQVQQAAAMGLPRRQIAALIGIDEDTLRKHYTEHLVLAEAKANMNVAATLFKAATSGQDTTAAIFWAKARMGWRDRVEVSGDPDAPLQVAVRRFSDEGSNG